MVFTSSTTQYHTRYAYKSVQYHTKRGRLAKEGFHSITVRERAYDMAKRKAQKDRTSVAEVVERAVERYAVATDDAEEKIRKAITVMKEQGIL